MVVVTDLSRISIEPGKRGGRPCVRGLRIAVYDVLGWLASGMSEAPSPTYVADFLATSDGLSLTKAFMRIKSSKLRRRIVDLVEQIAGIN